MLDIDSQLEEQEQSNRNGEPFFKLPFDKVEDKSAQDKVHTWLKNEKNHLLKVNEPRHNRIKRNLAINKGLLYKDDDRKAGDAARENTSKKLYQNKVVINSLKEANRVRASKLLKYKPAVAVLPASDEMSKQVAAGACENLIKSIWYDQKFEDKKLKRLVKSKGPCGEMYLFIEWNPNLGELAEDYKKAKEFGDKNKLDKVPLLGEDGQPERDEQGQIKWVEKPVYNGDVEYDVDNPLNVLFDPHPSKDIAKSRYVFRRKLMYPEEARLKWPDAADKIKGNKDTLFYDFDECHTYKDEQLVEVWFFYHRRHETIDKGRMVVFTEDGILSNKEFPYTHWDLPCVRFFDIENEGEMHASSFFDDVKGLNSAYNNVTNMILRNEYLCSHPKWMMPQGAADIRELGNGITIVQYKGAVEPKLVQSVPTSQATYQLREMLKSEISQNSDVSRTGNGEPPKGVTAAVALQFLAELEGERWNEAVLDHAGCILEVPKMTLAVAGDYYHQSDKRMIKVQGIDNEWTTEFFNTADLTGGQDIRIQNVSALSETKSARLETLFTLAEKFPDRVDPDQILDMFEFAQSKKFIKEATISLRAAEAENEMFLKMKPVPEPVIYEDHIVHWKAHVRRMRDWAFKNRSTPEIRKALEDHVMATEMLMTKIAARSPSFAAKVAALEEFPLFFVPALPPQPPPLPGGEMDPALAGQQLPAIQPEEQMPVQIPGEEVNQDLPNIDQQEGFEQQPLDELQQETT